MYYFFMLNNNLLYLDQFHKEVDIKLPLSAKIYYSTSLFKVSIYVTRTVYCIILKLFFGFTYMLTLCRLK